MTDSLSQYCPNCEAQANTIEELRAANERWVIAFKQAEADATGRIEALSAENERLREQLSGISGRLEAMRVALIHTAGICNPLGGFLKNVTGLRKKHLNIVQDIARTALQETGR